MALHLFATDDYLGQGLNDCRLGEHAWINWVILRLKSIIGATIMNQASAPQTLATSSSKTTSWTWTWKTQALNICFETWGQGTPLVLLPAFSTVSSRHELRAMAMQLLQQFPDRVQVITLDWPGFGDSDRPKLSYEPTLYHQFLQDFIRELAQPPVLIAAGHAAGYALTAANQGLCTKLVLVAPTWRGPLAVMGAPKGVRTALRELVRSPLLGQALYGLNTRPSFLKWMYRRHVFVDATQLTPDYLAQRHQNTQKTGARYAPAAFVTGGLDPVESREAFLQMLAQCSIPIGVVIADQAPPSSKAEMEAIATALSSSSPTALFPMLKLPGSLGLGEEYGVEVAEAIASFLVL